MSGGSELKAAGILNIYSVSGTNGVGLLLDRVQLCKVVEGFSGDGEGFEPDEDGEFSVDDVDEGFDAADDNKDVDDF